MITLDKLKNYNQLRLEVIKQRNEIDKYVRRWVDKHFEDWQHYMNWVIDGENIIITYSYTDYENNIDSFTEFSSETISIEDFIKDYNL